MPKVDKKNFFMPIKILPDNFHVEVDKTSRGLSLSCSGVRGISELSDTEIKIKLSDFSLLICGKGLVITVFEERSIEIIGTLSEVKFVYGKS